MISSVFACGFLFRRLFICWNLISSIDRLGINLDLVVILSAAMCFLAVEVCLLGLRLSLGLEIESWAYVCACLFDFVG